MITLLSYDCLGNVTKKEIFSSTGELIGAETNIYNGFHLTSSTDTAGRTTFYRYDGAGRLIAVEKQDRLVTYEFDSMGRQWKTFEWYGSSHK